MNSISDNFGKQACLEQHPQMADCQRHPKTGQNLLWLLLLAACGGGGGDGGGGKHAAQLATSGNGQVYGPPLVATPVYRDHNGNGKVDPGDAPIGE